MDNPLASIIIPAYNRADLIGETLDSVLAQTYTHWECIVVDDGSTDNTKQVVQQYVEKDPRFTLVDRSDTHKPGGNGARNYGFEISKGEYILWFDADDLMLPEYLKSHISALKNSNADFSICKLEQYFPESGNRKKWLSDDWTNDSPEDFVKNYIMFNYGIGIISVVWKREVLYGKKLFDESLHRSQEYEFFCRLFIPLNLQKAVVEKVLVLYRQTKNNFINRVKAGDPVKIESALTAKLSVLGTLKKYNRLDDELRRYFITDAISYLPFDLEITRIKVSEILMACGYQETDAKHIVQICLQVIRQTNNRVNINDLADFACQQPSALSVRWYVARHAMARVRKQMQQKTKRIFANA